MQALLQHIQCKKTYYVSLFMVLLVVTAFTSSNKKNSQPKKSQPNIIVIVIDDAGYADFGFMGSKDLQTPNIDALAAQSIRFTDAHVSATVCGPSRAGLITGKYQQRFGYECNEGNGYTGVDSLQTFISTRLQKKGYATGAFGKWHLGFEKNQHPLQKGFNYYYGFLSGGRSYFYQPSKDDKVNSKSAIIENITQVSFDGYLTDVLADKAISFINKQQQKPFFIYWAPNAVHTPMEATQSDLDRFNNHPRQKLAAMTFALDRAIGKMVDALKKQGIFENTLIFFISDNGGAHNNQSINLPLKGFKGNKFEAGHRIPFFISWPKQIQKGQKFTGLTSSLDIYPTALQAANIPIEPTLQLDGVSLIPFIKGQKKDNPHDVLFWRKDAAAAVRYKHHKLISIKNAGEALYDLSTDVGETNNIQQNQPKVFASLKAKLIEWEKDKIKPLWTEGKDWDTITLMIHDDLLQNKKPRVRNIEELKRFQQKQQN
ncbi:MAG: sulfatase-like hydrolase/transferase [Chitinophagaceae bacterium]